MSYLFPPRLHFSGQFRANTATVNNDPRHYDNRTFRSNFDLPGSSQSANGAWNPPGSGAWTLSGCAVQRVVYADGSSSVDPRADIAVGAVLRGADSRVPAKMVDLDAQQQGVSEIWGFQVILDGAAAGFASDFEVTAFSDIWLRCPTAALQKRYGAYYQSVLRLDPDSWKTGGSRFLKELCRDGHPPELLSIRFNLDGFDDDPTSPTFTFGRIVGSIGTYSAGEPNHFISGRVLDPVPLSPLKSAYGQISNGILYLDLGNSLPTESAGGPPVLTLSLQAAILATNGQAELLGPIPCGSPAWYPQTAGIVAFPLTPNQIAMAANHPLAIFEATLTGPQPVLVEAANGVFARADDFVFRLNPGDTCAPRMYVTAFGVPLANQSLSLAHDSPVPQGKAGPGNATNVPPAGVPREALSFPQSVTTNSDGAADVELTAYDPGKPRDYIDGQIYTVAYTVGAAPPPPSPPFPVRSRLLNVLVFSGFTVPAEPTWLEDIQPIFQQYDNLYPVMRPIVDLSNYASVIGRLAILRQVFAAPESDPNYMPVSRDLSRAKREMIRQWLARPVYMRLDSLADLIQALQVAVELEHSTIPPYLCALYSIKEGSNAAAGTILKDIVTQEMAHMARVCNLLIALGGGPDMDDPSFIPRYPGPLPGGLRAGLTVRLRRCSIAQVRDVFMSIEEPERTDSPDTVTAYGGPVQPHRFTIGWFYSEIDRALEALHRSGELTFGHAERQLAHWPGSPDVAGGSDLRIVDLPGAREAIKTIKEQGESSKPLGPDASADEIGHYYRFREIVEGRRLVIDPETKSFSFTGDRIPFDPDGVWPIVDDPDIGSYPPGSRAAVLAKQFAAAYRALLKGLHRTFNQDPNHLEEAIGLMYSLNLAARELVRTPSGLGDGTTAGPVFSSSEE